MTDFWREIIWKQFSATIDMFGNALSACPDKVWNVHMWHDGSSPTEFSTFWYVAYHTLFWLDLYLSGAVEGFVPPAPFDLNELDPRGLLPEKSFNKDELQAYWAYCRQKCRDILQHLTDEQAHRKCHFPWSKGELTFAELLLDNMRHVQEHGAQLNMFLGQQAGITARWVAQANEDNRDVSVPGHASGE